MPSPVWFSGSVVNFPFERCRALSRSSSKFKAFLIFQKTPTPSSQILILIELDSHSVSISTLVPSECSMALLSISEKPYSQICRTLLGSVSKSSLKLSFQTLCSSTLSFRETVTSLFFSVFKKYFVCRVVPDLMIFPSRSNRFKCLWTVVRLHKKASAALATIFFGCTGNFAKR